MPRIKELFLLDIVVAIYKIKETIKSFTCGDDLKHNYMVEFLYILFFQYYNSFYYHN